MYDGYLGENKMNDAQIDRILDGVDKVAEKLGVAADFVMDALVKQVYLNAATYILVGTIILGIAIAVLAKGGKIAKANDAIIVEQNQMIIKNNQPGDFIIKNNKPGAYYYNSIKYEKVNQTVVWIISGLMLLISIWIYVPGIQRLINPEYFAMLKFMRLLQQI